MGLMPCDDSVEHSHLLRVIFAWAHARVDLDLVLRGDGRLVPVKGVLRPSGCKIITMYRQGYPSLSVMEHVCTALALHEAQAH